MRLFPIAFLLCAAGAAMADETGWIMEDYQKGLEVAKKAGKLVQMDWSAEWCGWCKKLEAETYSDADVKKYIDATFVNVRMDKDKNGDLADKMGVGGIPALLFIDGEGRIVSRIVGFLPADKYLEAVKGVQESYTKLTALEEVCKKNASDLESHLAAAKIWAEAESWEPANVHFKAVIDGDKDNAKGLAAGAWVESAKARAAMGDVAGTTEALAKSLGYDKDNKSGTYDNLAVACGRNLIQKDGKAARAIFEKVIADFPKEDGAPEASFMIGAIIADVDHDLDAAKAHFEKLAEEFPESPWAARVPQVLKNIEKMKSQKK